MAGTLRATIFTAVKGDAAEKLAKQLDGLSGKMTNFGSMASKAVKGVASLGAALVSSKFIGDSVEQAKNLERSILALDSVFGATAPRMVEFSKNAVSMGLSQSEAAKASTFLGSVLQQYGFDADSAAVETEKLTKLSADLAATYGYDVQEALLAVTALFRGEYDPIEKFGVAMKQNEINAIRAARGLGDLTGAAEMQADAQIRLELLMERSTKAQGAMERGAGTLYVETEKLRATFENLQANLGQQLIPVFAELFEKLRPIIEDAAPALVEIFTFVGEVIKQLAEIFTDLFDPTTVIGESVMALGNAFESLFQTIFGRDFNIAAVFDGVRAAIDLVLRALNDIVLIIENIIIAAQAAGTWIGALFTGDWETIRKGADGVARELYATRDAALEAANAMDVLYYKAAQSLKPEALGDQTEVWDKIAENAAKAGLNTGTQFGDNLMKGAGAATKDAVADFWAGLTEEVEKQAARMRLEAMGASEGLIGAILGASGDWQKVFDSIVSGGIAAVTRAQEIFNKTAAGIKEIEQAAKDAKEQLDKLRDAEISRARQSASANADSASYYNTYAQMLEAGYEKEVAMQVAREEYAEALFARNQALIRQQKELANAFTASANEIFSAFSSSGATQQLGEYATAVQTLRESLTELIQDNGFDSSTGLFSKKSQATLVTSLNNVTDLMLTVANARDEIATQITDAESQLSEITGQRQSLFESIVDSIIGSVNVTQLGASANTIIKTLQRTLDQTKNFSTQIDQLRAMGLQESAIQQIIQAGAVAGGATATALIKGGETAISQINSLQTELNNVASDIGAKAADSMYGSGIEATQSLVDGLLSQEQQFVQAAEYLASTFRRSFNRAVAGQRINITTPTLSEILASTASQSVAATAAMARPAYSTAGNTYSITVNAAMATNGQSLGQMIVDEIKRFERQSGKVFVSA